MEPGFEPRAAGWEARMLPLCYSAPVEEVVRFTAKNVWHDLYISPGAKWQNLPKLDTFGRCQINLSLTYLFLIPSLQQNYSYQTWLLLTRTHSASFSVQPYWDGTSSKRRSCRVGDGWHLPPERRRRLLCQAAAEDPETKTRNNLVLDSRWPHPLLRKNSLEIIGYPCVGGIRLGNLLAN